MIVIDGGAHEGGGQIVRTALALSVVTGRPVRVVDIRKGRERPGLKVQHVKCVEALERLCGATHSGVRVGSTELEFVPGRLRGGSVTVDMGTAGSVTLLLQSLLLPLACAPRACKVVLRGGTDVKWSMPIGFVQEVLLPHVSGFFGKLEVRVLRRGYYPKGGGEVVVRSSPRPDLSGLEGARAVLDALSMAPLVCDTRGALQKIGGLAHASDDLEGARVVERMVGGAKQALLASDVIGHASIRVDQEYSASASSGAGLTLWARFEDEREHAMPCIVGGDALGERGVRAEEVGRRAAAHLLRHVTEGACVDPHVADNLVPFLALAGGRIRTGEVTAHTLANIYVCERMLGARFVVQEGLVSAEAGEFEVVLE